MTDNQIIAGLILNSLFFSMGHNIRGVKTRDKIMMSLQRKINEKRKQKNNNLDELIEMANNYFKESWKDYETGIEVQIPKIAYVMVTAYNDLFKPYKVNLKYIMKLNAIEGKGKPFNDSSVANNLLKRVVNEF